MPGRSTRALSSRKVVDTLINSDIYKYIKENENIFVDIARKRYPDLLGNIQSLSKDPKSIGRAKIVLE